MSSEYVTLKPLWKDNLNGRKIQSRRFVGKWYINGSSLAIRELQVKTTMLPLQCLLNKHHHVLRRVGRKWAPPHVGKSVRWLENPKHKLHKLTTGQFHVQESVQEKWKPGPWKKTIKSNKQTGTAFGTRPMGSQGSHQWTCKEWTPSRVDVYCQRPMPQMHGSKQSLPSVQALEFPTLTQCLQKLATATSSS